MSWYFCVRMMFFFSLSLTLTHYTYKSSQLSYLHMFLIWRERIKKEAGHTIFLKQNFFDLIFTQRQSYIANYYHAHMVIT
jgi:hypothetical protein